MEVQSHGMGGIRDTAQSCSGQIRKVKAHLDLNLETAVKGNKRSLYMYGSFRREASENVGLKINGARDLVAENKGKANVLSVHFSLVFAGMTKLQESQASKTHRNTWNEEELALLILMRIRLGKT